jgi:hypothetical protein
MNNEPANVYKNNKNEARIRVIDPPKYLLLRTLELIQLRRIYRITLRSNTTNTAINNVSINKNAIK